MGADWQIKGQGLASNWQSNLVVTPNHTGEQDAHTVIEVCLSLLTLFLEHNFFVCNNGNYCDSMSLSTHMSNFISDFCGTSLFLVWNKKTSEIQMGYSLKQNSDCLSPIVVHSRIHFLCV